MEIESLLFLAIIAFFAYTIKGLTGFGPALIVVPFFTMIMGVHIALPASAVFDIIAGLILLVTIYKHISWKFCVPLMIAIGIGSFIGANVVFIVPQSLIKLLIGTFIFLFGIYLWIEKMNYHHQTVENTKNKYVFSGAVIAGFWGGISGGLVGMSGPILVIYLKYFFKKDFFRTQLIAIFLIENLVRIFIYFKGGLLNFQESKFLIACLPSLLLGLWVGSIVHFHVSEKQFNRSVSIILILISLKMTLF